MATGEACYLLRLGDHEVRVTTNPSDLTCPPRYHPLGRTTPTGQRLPLSPARLTLQKLRRGQAQVGRKDIIFIKYPLATAKDLPKGL